MKIYDFERFEESCKNIKAIKFKKWEDITDKNYYYSNFSLWGKSLTVKFLKKELGSFYFVDENSKRVIYLSKKNCKDTIEYVITNSGLEIE